MPVELPNFRDTHCVALRVCGRIRPSTDSPFGTEKTAFVTQYESGGETIFARIALTPSKDGSAHLHFDFGTKTWFDYREFFPAVNSSVEAFVDKVSAFDGVPYEASVDAFFGLSEEQLPVPVARLVASSKFDGKEVQVEMTAGKLKFTGTPHIAGVSWEHGEHPSGYLVTVELKAPEKVRDDLFVSAVSIASKFLQHVSPKRAEHG